MFVTPGSNLTRRIFPGSKSDRTSYLGGRRTTQFDPSPANENQEGKVYSYVPRLRGFALRHPKIFFGPGALDGSSGSISLTNNTWVPLYSGIPGDGIGFRSGMVQYPPKGRYGIFGHVAIATPTVNCSYKVRLQQGTTEINPVTQPRISSGSPVTVGGGIGVSPPVANIPFSIAFSASDIQFGGAFAHANEIWVEVYADTASSGAGAALNSTGVAAVGTISKLTIIRWDGLAGGT